MCIVVVLEAEHDEVSLNCETSIFNRNNVVNDDVGFTAHIALMHRIAQ
jgi:hypothetical protein